MRPLERFRRPCEGLRRLIGLDQTDDLIRSLQRVLALLIEGQGFSLEDFGVFGSLLYGFHNPKFSDLDIIVYGGECLRKLRDRLSDLCGQRGSPLRMSLRVKALLRVRSGASRT
ncbi:MAG: hypothetical protein QXX56_04215 [Candidatus Bathyarchaeia archaeon]